MFSINAQTSLSVSDPKLAEHAAVERALDRFRRDMRFTLAPSALKGTRIRIDRHPGFTEESWSIVASEDEMAIAAGGVLGAVYGLLHVSHVALGIEPLWFWNDQRFSRRRVRRVHGGKVSSELPAYRYRGWFLNDEVLLSTWTPSADSAEPWEMAFEALLRLGGNLVIPGTDGNCRKYAGLAASMGLTIAQHHAEPLGAEMFSRAYPGLDPSYVGHPDLFEKLWEDALDRQKDFSVVWTIGFRGQGDIPFWDNDPQFDTDEKRGRLLSLVLEKQAALIRARHPDAAIACNLYGESVELYGSGFVKLPPDVIRIWGDNGYGRMVGRRQGLSDPRHPAVPDESEKTMMHGMYYHVSFYDLQAANHITMTPVPFDLMKKELENAYAGGIDDLLILNVSNVKPHALPAAFVASFWHRGKIDVTAFLREYAAAYFTEASDAVAEACLGYAPAALSYGGHDDEKAGDQFYTYTVRGVIGRWLTGDVRNSIQSLGWFLSGPFPREIERLHEMARHAVESYTDLNGLYGEVSKKLGRSGRLFNDTFAMYAGLYLSLAKTLLLCTESAGLFIDGRYVDAFLRCGEAAEENEKAVKTLRGWEHGKWTGFYANDCLTDISGNTYLLTVLMEHIRAFGDAPEYFRWQRLLTYSEEDRDVVLITNWEKHMTAWELYQAHKRRG